VSVCLALWIVLVACRRHAEACEASATDARTGSKVTQIVKELVGRADNSRSVADLLGGLRRVLGARRVHVLCSKELPRAVSGCARRHKAVPRGRRPSPSQRAAHLVSHRAVRRVASRFVVQGGERIGIRSARSTVPWWVREVLVRWRRKGLWKSGLAT
jgi:hypothetical protein